MVHVLENCYDFANEKGSVFQDSQQLFFESRLHYRLVQKKSENPDSEFCTVYTQPQRP